MKKLAVLFALVATLFSLNPAMAAPPEGPASSISVYAGGAFMSEYYDDCGYYYDHSNDTLSHTSVFLRLAVHF